MIDCKLIEEADNLITLLSRVSMEAKYGSMRIYSVIKKARKRFGRRWCK